MLLSIIQRLAALYCAHCNGRKAFSSPTPLAFSLLRSPTLAQLVLNVALHMCKDLRQRMQGPAAEVRLDGVHLNLISQLWALVLCPRLAILSRPCASVTQVGSIIDIPYKWTAVGVAC